MFKLTQVVMGILIAGFLIMLRPPALGGNASYITVNQAGLEPLLYVGDLAIVKQQTDYAAGELVAVETQGGPYFGRILGQDGEIFRIRFVVGAEPVAVSEEYLLGRIWFSIGNIGRRVEGSVLRP
jgi:hypothetical protein